MIESPLVRGMAPANLRLCSRQQTSKTTISGSESLRRWSDLGDEIAHKLFVRKRRERHFTRLETGGTGIDRLAVDPDHAFLAGIGVDAGETDRQRGVLVDAQPAQAVEHRLARLERHLEGLPRAVSAIRAAPDFQRRDIAHDTSAPAVVGAPDIFSVSPASTTR